MRKTQLWFEKQPSPEFYYPKVTRDGRAVSMKQKPKSNLSRSKRFSQYETDAKRLGTNVGPGSYVQSHFSIISALSTSPKVSRYFYRHKDSLENSHYYQDYSTTVPNFLKFRT